MIRKLLLSMLTLTVFMSCSFHEIEVDFPERATVTFLPTTQSLTPLTRADASVAGTPTCLIVLDYVDGKLNSVCTRGYDDKDIDSESILSALSLQLDCGQHTLYFVSSAVKWTSRDDTNHTLTWASVAPTWAAKVEVNVNQVNMPQVAVNMDLCVSLVGFYINDVMPADAARLKMSLGMKSLTYNYFEGKGTEGTPWENSRDISSTYIGKNNAFFSTYTFVPSNATETTIEELSASNIGNVTVTIYNASGNELGAKTVSNVGIIVGYETAIRGDFFSVFNQPYTMTIETTYKGTLNMTY